MGEPEKACDWMIKGAGGIGTDVFLTRWIFHDFINSKILRIFENGVLFEICFALRYSLFSIYVYVRETKFSIMALSNRVGPI